MFKYWSIKKYGSKLLPLLEKQFGQHAYYTPSQVRSTVYQKNFDPTYLPLGYILFVEPNLLKQVLSKEFPNINTTEFKHEIITYLHRKSYSGYLDVLQKIVA